MIRFLLDTDSLTLLQWGMPAVLQRVNNVPRSEIALCTIVLEEQMAGWQGALRSARNSQQLAMAHDRLVERLLPTWLLFTALPFNEPAIIRFEQLKAMRLNVASNDLRIAAIALEHDLTVVTRNARDFGRVPGLTIEDWSM